ncbi:ribonuclease M5 [Lacticigenium naphthae]|uniref:ribonuclease M5 n=1 Tax=Lacticigenium naphthae TaxID=515351 RepID=UPI0003FFAE1C|nr:ribonuclease M5 [Lacticigenium naphthae]
MKKIKEIIVVEGRDDTKKIKQFFEADTIETRGSAIDNGILHLIEKAQGQRGVIVFTDPDFPGEKIRKIISQAVPGVKHAFLSQAEARPKHKGSLGIEHASKKAIEKALEGVYQEEIAGETADRITKGFLLRKGLTGQPNSKERRIRLGDFLRIGYVNGKQLEKRLNMFGFKEVDVCEALHAIDARDEADKERE